MLLSHVSKGIEIAGRRESLQNTINGSGQSEIDIAERQIRGLLDWSKVYGQFFGRLAFTCVSQSTHELAITAAIASGGRRH